MKRTIVLLALLMASVAPSHAYNLGQVVATTATVIGVNALACAVNPRLGMACQPPVGQYAVRREQGYVVSTIPAGVTIVGCPRGTPVGTICYVFPRPSAGTTPPVVESVAPTQPTCTIAGTVYVAAVGGCVKHVTNVTEVRQASPDIANDSRCKGKPPGFRYDVAVAGGGIAHRVCGKRA